MSQKEKYTGQNIKVLEGLEAVRLRPGMYIGSTDSFGLHHLIFEVLDNAIDEHIIGKATHIKIVIDHDLVTIEDNGRGIPTEYNDKLQMNTLEIVFGILHAGGKFENQNYKFSSGLHGVGISVVNALSEKLDVTVYRNKKKYTQSFSKGKKICDISQVKSNHADTGTIVSFTPDRSIFLDHQFDRKYLENRLLQLNALNSGLNIEFVFKDDKEEYKRVFIDGKLEDLIDLKERVLEKNVYFSHKAEDIELDFCFNYDVNSSNEYISAFVNNIHTFNGGTHVALVRNNLTKFFLDFLKKNLPKETFEASDIKNGLFVVIHAKLNDPIFMGQTKEKLSSPLTQYGLGEKIQECLFNYFLSNMQNFKILLDFFRSNKKQRTLMQDIKTNVKKSYVDSASLPGKLADCSNKDIKDREIILVEGESAGGTAKQARDRHSQAVLCLQGKFLNAGKHEILRLKKNAEISSLLQAIGIDISKNNLDGLRYGKIIIMTDADPDGHHIKNLFLIFFFKFMRIIIEQGILHIAVAPLYGIKLQQHGSSDKIAKYCFDEEELEESLNTIFKDKKIFIQRFKGLGEMNAEQLWLTTISKENRRLIKINIDDCEKAEKTMNDLMGINAQFRKELVMSTMGKKIEAIETEIDINELEVEA